MNAQSDGRTLSDAILSMDSERLAATLALLKEIGFLAALFSKAKDLSTRSTGAFENKLKEATERLKKEPRGALVLRVQGQLSKTLRIPGRNYAAKKDFEDNCEDIVRATCALLRGQKREFKGETLQELVKFQTAQMFSQIQKRFDEMGEEERTRVVAEIKQHLELLPEDQQRVIKEKLGTEQLTEEVVRRAVVAGTLGAAFAVAVEIGGFGFYMAATSMLASLAGLIGITLPFSFYTGLTSAVAVLANPLFLAIALGGGGYLLYRRNDRKLRESLMPVIVTQIAAAGMMIQDPKPDQGAELALAEWEEAAGRVRRLRAESQSAEEVLDAASKEHREATARFKASREKKKRADNLRREVIARLRSQFLALADEMASGACGERLTEPAGDLVRAIARHREITDRPVNTAEGGNWGARILRAFDVGKKKVEGFVSEGEIEVCLDKLLAEVRGTWRKEEAHLQNHLLADLQVLDERENELHQMERELREAEAEKKAAKLKLDRKKELFTKAQEEVRRAEGVFYGLETVE